MIAAQTELRIALDQLGEVPSADAITNAVNALRLAWVELVTMSSPRDLPILSPQSQAFAAALDELSRKVGPLHDTRLDPVKERIELYRFLLGNLQTHGVAEVIALIEEFRQHIERGRSITESLALLAAD
jgi:hypothetical protein